MEFYYIDGLERKGPIGTNQLKTLAALGKILRETELELEDGRRIQARQVKGLVFKGETPPENGADDGVYGVAAPTPPTNGAASGFPFPPSGAASGFPFQASENAASGFPFQAPENAASGFPFPPSGAAASNVVAQVPEQGAKLGGWLQGTVDKLAPRASAIVLGLAALCFALGLLASAFGFIEFLGADKRGGFLDSKMTIACFSCLIGAIYFSASALLTALSFCASRPRN